jgi:hypothetical protein
MGLGSNGTKKDKPITQTTSIKASRFNDAKFVNYELDKTAQASCKAWSIDASALFDGILKMCEVGYRFTLKYDHYSKAYACFVQQTEDKGKNSGYILTARGSTPEKAVKQALYKHYEVMAGDWEDFGERSKLDEIDD